MALIVYAACLHIALLLLLFKGNWIHQQTGRFRMLNHASETTDHYLTMLAFHLRADPFIPNGSVLFIGDSLIQGLWVQAVSSKGVNFGIGTDTTAGVIQRLPLYKSLKKASGVVLHVGFNDIRRRSNEKIAANFRTILSMTPREVPILVSAILPVDERVREFGLNTRIIQINSAINELCTSRPNCSFLDSGPLLRDSSGNLRSDLHTGDGIHLNGNGYGVWIEELKKSYGRLVIVASSRGAGFPFADRPERINVFLQ